MSLPRWLPIALLGAILAVAGGSLLFSTFMIYDDEGYVLFSLQEFTRGGGLYERIYSQYGPFFFLFNQGLHFAGLEFTNTGGRLITLIYWLATTGFCGALVWRTTRSVAATVFTLSGVFIHLWPMISEPSHPGGFIVFATAAMAWCGVQWSEQPRRLAVAVGLIGAALLLTKINVGVFLIAGAGTWWALQADMRMPGFRVRALLVGGAMTLLPVALMRGLMGQTWVVIFAVVSAAAGAGTVMAAASAARAATPKTGWRDLGLALGVGTLVGLITCGAIIAQGTSLRSLLEGVLLGPLRHPQVYSAYVKWRPGVLVLALGSLAFAAWATARPSAAVHRVVAAGRILAATVFYVLLSVTLPIDPHAFAMSYALSTVWWFVLPIGGDRTTQPARTWLALLLVPQALHAFPVAGSQISWGTFLWVPLAAIGACDAARMLAPAGAAIRRRLGAITAAALIIAALVNGGYYTWLGVTRLRTSDPLGLPGAGALRLPGYFTSALRVLAQNASVHADLLFSLPGLHSFHLWTGVPAPTSTNATHWFTLLSPAQQDAIQARLAAAPRSCVIVETHNYEFLVRTGIATESPLTVWLKANYEPAFVLETYEFWVRKGRTIAALGTATAREAAPGVAPRYQLSLTLAASALAGITAIELAHFDDTGPISVTSWTNADARLTIAPLNSAGRLAGATRPVTFPFSASGLVKIELLTDRFPPGYPNSHSVLYLRDAAGRRIAEARLVK
jgi:hypothetical protein